MRNKILSIFFGVLILTTIAGIVYIAHLLPTKEKYTEFYLLGADGKADNYPTTLVEGQTAEVIIGVVNNEFKEIAYRIEIRADAAKNDVIGPINLNHGQEWERPVKFNPGKAGDKQKFEFLLFREGEQPTVPQPLPSNRR